MLNEIELKIEKHDVILQEPIQIKSLLNVIV